MKYLYNNFVENFLFEQKFLNLIGKPKSGPEGLESAHEKAPSMQDIHTRIKHIRKNLDKIKGGKNNKTKDVLGKHLNKIEKRMLKLEDSLGSKVAKNKVIGETYLQLEKIMILHGIEVRDRLVSPKDVVNQNLNVLQTYLKNMVENKSKRLKISRTGVRNSTEYQDISKAIKTVEKGLKKVEKKGISKSQKDKIYFKANYVLVQVATKYNVELTPYKLPTGKNTLDLIQTMKDRLDNVKDKKVRTQILKRLIGDEKHVKKIMASDQKPRVKQKMIKNIYDILKKGMVDYGLDVGEKMPVDQLVDAKITYLKEKLKAERIKEGASHLKAMKWSPRYKRIFNQLESVRAEYDSAMKTTNPKEKNKKLMDLNKKIDAQVKAAKISLPKDLRVAAAEVGKGKLRPKSRSKVSLQAKAKPFSEPKQYAKPGNKKFDVKKIKSPGMRKFIGDLQNLETGFVKNYQYALEKIAFAVQKMGGGKRGPLDKVITESLPGGYRIATINWPNIKARNISNDTMVNLVIYNSKGEIVCVREGHSWMRPDKSPQIRKVAEVIKSNSIMNDVTKKLARIQAGDNPGGNDKVRFKSLADLDEFKNALASLGKNMTLNPPPTKPKLIIRNKDMRIYFKSTGAGQGEFEINIFKPKFITLFFNTQTGKLGTATLKNENGKSKLVSKGYDNEMDAMSVTELNKMNEMKKQKETKETALKDQKAMKSNINPKYRGVCKFQKNPKYGYEFTVNADIKKPKEKALLKGGLGKMVNLKDMTHRIAIFTITDSKGKNPRKGIFVPGQRGKKIPYLIEKGKVSSKPLRFSNGDKIKIQYKGENSAEFKTLVKGKIKRNFENNRKKSKLETNIRKVAYLKKKLLEFAKKKDSRATHPLAMRHSKKYKTAYNKLKSADNQLNTAKTTNDLAVRKQTVNKVDRDVKAQMDAYAKEYKVTFKKKF